MDITTSTVILLAHVAGTRVKRVRGLPVARESARASRRARAEASTKGEKQSFSSRTWTHSRTPLKIGLSAQTPCAYGTHVGVPHYSKSLHNHGTQLPNCSGKTLIFSNAKNTAMTSRDNTRWKNCASI